MAVLYASQGVVQYLVNENAIVPTLEHPPASCCQPLEEVKGMSAFRIFSGNQGQGLLDHVIILAVDVVVGKLQAVDCKAEVESAELERGQMCEVDVIEEETNCLFLLEIVGVVFETDCEGEKRGFEVDALEGGILEFMFFQEHLP